MPLDLTNPELLGLVDLVRREPDAAGIFVDWLMEMPRSWDETRQEYRATGLADVLRLYALPPPLPKQEPISTLYGFPVVLAFDPTVDDSMRPVLETWLTAHRDHRAHEARSLRQKRQVLELFDDVRVQITRSFRQVYQIAEADPDRIRLQCDGIDIVLSKEFPGRVEERHDCTIVTWWGKPSDLIPPHFAPAHDLMRMRAMAELLADSVLPADLLRRRVQSEFAPGVIPDAPEPRGIMQGNSLVLNGEPLQARWHMVPCDPPVVGPDEHDGPVTTRELSRRMMTRGLRPRRTPARR